MVLSTVATLSAFVGNEAQVVNTKQTHGDTGAYITAQNRVIEPREYLRELAGPDFNLLDRIVWCESGWNPKAQSKHSTAGGLFQFLDSTWLRYSDSGMEKYSPYDNIRAGIALYKKEGTVPWVSSRGCWK